MKMGALAMSAPCAGIILASMSAMAVVTAPTALSTIVSHKWAVVSAAVMITIAIPPTQPEPKGNGGIVSWV